MQRPELHNKQLNLCRLLLRSGILFLSNDFLSSFCLVFFSCVIFRPEISDVTEADANDTDDDERIRYTGKIIFSNF